MNNVQINHQRSKDIIVQSELESRAAHDLLYIINKIETDDSNAHCMYDNLLMGRLEDEVIQ